MQNFKPEMYMFISEPSACNFMPETGQLAVHKKYILPIQVLPQKIDIIVQNLGHANVHRSIERMQWCECKQT